VRVSPRPGALVISIDFELQWGTRDHADASGSLARLHVASREIVSRLADLFVERGVRATWATVGFLFASSAAELERFNPELRPSYTRRELDPYSETLGTDEGDDPVHLAGSLVDRLVAASGQEVASHTYSHYYCLEAGQDQAQFSADLAAARAIARSRGVTLRSLVLPRNQWREDYAPAARDNGFDCLRGPQPTWGHRPRRSDEVGPLVRAARLAESYAGVRPPPTFAWDEIVQPTGMCNVPASAFVRPFSPARRGIEPWREARLRSGLRDAARRGRIFHVWWHPSNFASHPVQSFGLLERLLDEFERLAGTDGLQSLAMGDVAEALLAPPPGGPEGGGRPT
jgi:peptidoglycan/xylan/chitin deacetylase (PgdA/CDA1 family)